MAIPRSLVTLLTDFGVRDYFVASMKGVILTIAPHVQIVDLSHHVPPQSVEEGAYLLKSCYRYFPNGTVHIAVVDPGVGTARRPILVSTSRYVFLAPDNGLLTYILQEESVVEIRRINNPEYRLPSEGTTFDGRDLFAPAGAWLVQGRAAESFGPLIHDPVRLPIAEPAWDNRSLIGQIIYVDHFGNLISNFTHGHVDEVLQVSQRPWPRIRIGSVTIEGLVASYSEGDRLTPRALINSNGQVEIFLRNENAARTLKAKQGQRVDLL